MILDKLLRKKGVKFKDLNTEEKDTYKSWEEALAGRRITDEDVQQFMTAELDDAVGKLIVTGLGERDDIFLKMKVEFIKKIQAFLDGPRIEKENIKRAIESQT